MITFTPEALAQATEAQRDAVLYLHNERVESVNVGTGASLSLPESYLAFNQIYREGSPIYGGIDAEGRVST